MFQMKVDTNNWYTKLLTPQQLYYSNQEEVGHLKFIYIYVSHRIISWNSYYLQRNSFPIPSLYFF